MLNIVLNIASLSVALFIEACRAIVTKMTGNANFPTPTPALLTITTAINNLETAYQSWLSGSKTSHAQLKSLRLAVTTLMNQLKGYVQATSGTNVAIALSSGMSIKRPPTPRNNVGQVLNVRALPLPANGEAQVKWNAVRNNKAYNLYKTTNLVNPMDSATWTLVASTTRGRMQVAGLPSGQRTAFIVVAIGSRGIMGQPSDPAIVMAA